MPKKSPTSKKTATKSASTKKVAVEKGKSQPANPVVRIFRSIRSRTAAFLARRSHRSFRLTRRRDYVRSLTLPGYWAFTNQVKRVLTQHRRLFLWVVLFYGGVTALLIGLISQDNYTSLSETLRDVGGNMFSGGWGEVGQASLLLVSGIAGSFNSPLTEAQQVYTVIIFLLTWLTTVWLLRAIKTGAKPKFRDGLYNAGAPIIPTFIVSFTAIVQLLPVALAGAGFSAAIATGMFEEGGIESMLFWTLIAALLGLSLYWMVSTFIALIVVTLPGMRPWNAIKIAGDMVVGRRLRILLRILWLFFIVALIWIVVMVPIILLDTWLKGIWPASAWVPVIPVAMLVLGAFTVVWSASYIYLLYRKVVDDDADPA